MSCSLNDFIFIKSNDEDCHYPDWYHMKCFFKFRLPQTEAAFDGFAKLRYADQLALKVHLGWNKPFVVRFELL